jgi:hypothetical protein
MALRSHAGSDERRDSLYQWRLVRAREIVQALRSRMSGGNSIRALATSVHTCAAAYRHLCFEQWMPPRGDVAVSGFEKTMHRLTARFLLIFALVGNVTPLALAATAPPPHACCVRKVASHCHESPASQSSQPSIQASGCCGHECCRAAITAQWANPQPRAEGPFAEDVNARVTVSQPDSPILEVSNFQSGRAPPAC